MTTAAELAKIDALLKPPGPPERIYGWMNSQMSVARFYGGLEYQNHRYTIAINEPGQPLVRDDVLRREAKAKEAEQKAKRMEEKQRAQAAQKGLI